MSVNPTDLLAQRHKGYRQAQDRYRRAVTARQDAHQRVTELESELAGAEARDRDALGDALVDGHRPSKPEADSVRSQLDEAKREAEALTYAEQRAAGTLDRLPRSSSKDAWLGAAMRSFEKARDAYMAAITELARARDQLSDEATLVGFLHNNGAYTQPLGGAIQRRGSDNIDRPVDFAQLVALMLEEARGVEEKTRRDPNQPQPEPALHLMSGGGQKSWG